MPWTSLGVSSPAVEQWPSCPRLPSPKVKTFPSWRARDAHTRTHTHTTTTQQSNSHWDSLGLTHYTLRSNECLSVSSSVTQFVYAHQPNFMLMFAEERPIVNYFVSLPALTSRLTEYVLRNIYHLLVNLLTHKKFIYLLWRQCRKVV